MDPRKVGEQVWSACGFIEKIGQKIGWLFYIFPLVEIFRSGNCCPVAVKLSSDGRSSIGYIDRINGSYELLESIVLE